MHSSSILDELACSFGAQMRHVLVDRAQESGEHDWYVNYAYRDEREDKVYREKNVERLRGMKEVCDLEDGFGTIR
jgi:hypothetical protein